jgi:hypothetical protein
MFPLDGPMQLRTFIITVTVCVGIIFNAGCTEDTVGDDFEFTEDAGQDAKPAEEGPPCWPMRRGTPARNSTSVCPWLDPQLESARQIPDLEPTYIGFVRVDGSGTLYALGVDDSQTDYTLYKYEPDAASAEIIQEFHNGWTPVGPQPGDMALGHRGRVWLVEYRGSRSDQTAHRLAAYNPDGSLHRTVDIEVPGTLTGGRALRFHLLERDLRARLWNFSRRTIWSIDGDEVRKLGELNDVSGYMCTDGERLFHWEVILDMGSQPPPHLVVRDDVAPTSTVRKIPLDDLQDMAGSPPVISGEDTSCTVASGHVFLLPNESGQTEPNWACVAPLEDLEAVECHRSGAETFVPLPAGQHGVFYPPGTLQNPENSGAPGSYRRVDGTVLSELAVSGVGRNSTAFASPRGWIWGVTADLQSLYGAPTGVDAEGPVTFDVSNLDLQDVQWVLPGGDRVYIVDIDSDGDGFNRRVFEVK